MKTLTNFKVGDLVRWSHPRNSSSLPTLYGRIEKLNKVTVSLSFIGSSNHNEFQPSRNRQKISYQPINVKEIHQILDNSISSPGIGYTIKHLTIWIPQVN